VAVTNAIVLPVGGVFVPLAGDGIVAPFAMYATTQTVVMDASGGLASAIISLDSRYCSMVTVLGWTVAGAAADVEYAISISRAPNGQSAAVGVHGTLENTTLGAALAVSVRGFWSPPAMILGPGDGSNPAIGLNLDNIDGDTLVFDTQILLWDINVRNLTPWQVLAAAMPGSGSVSATNA